MRALHGVHKHPADKGGCRPFVETLYSLVADCLHYAVDGASKLSFLSGLKSNFDGVETASGQLLDSRGATDSIPTDVQLKDC